MRIHPNIPGTVGNWPLQAGSLVDISGNALTLAPLQCEFNTPAAAPPSVPLSNRTSGVTVNDPCLTGAQLFASTKLAAPLTPLLQFTGSFTIEWLMYQPFTYTWCYFACGDPAVARGPGNTGGLYCLYTDSGNPEMSDPVLNSAFPGYNDHALFNWSDASNPTGGDWRTHHFATVWDATGTRKVYRDGVFLAGSTVTSSAIPVATGRERFFIGSTEHWFTGFNGGGVFASVRVLNYARSQADILADAIAARSPCAGAFQFKGLLAKIRTVS